MNPTTIQYVRFRNGEWQYLFESNFKQGVTLVPVVGTVVAIPSMTNDFVVTRVRFDILHGNVEIEVSELYGTAA
jgi:hypothetical protein